MRQFLYILLSLDTQCIQKLVCLNDCIILIIETLLGSFTIKIIYKQIYQLISLHTLLFQVRQFITNIQDLN